MRYCASVMSLLLVMTAGPRADDGSAASSYRAALAMEHALRRPTGRAPTLSDMRAATDTYEAIARRFPASAYGDRALWQASGFALDAFERYHRTEDRETGRRLLDQLGRNYPDSPFTGRIAERTDRFAALGTLAWLTDIRREVFDEIARVTIEVDREVAFRAETLDDPARLFFDLDGTDAPPRFRNETLRFDDHVIRAIRLGRHPGDVTRVVLEADSADDCNILTLYDPFRIVTDCRRSDAERLAADSVGPDRPPTSPGDLDTQAATLPGATLRAETATPAPVVAVPPPPGTATVAGPDRTPLSMSRQLGLGISRVVIDAGHGGHDPGASARKLEEAELVLDITRRLEQRLAQYPIETVLTRRRDDYLPLEARTALANRVNADLFLSIHANASARPEARGVETYVLDFARTDEAAALAARENVDGAGAMHHLDDMLQTIVANVKAEESADFARLVQRSLVRKLRGIDPELPDLGVKRAPFLVLIGARMPSVLAEISFVSNPRDARLLATDTYRDLVADALVEAILSYQRSLKSRRGSRPLAADNGG